MLAARLGKGLVRALHDALRADVDPATRRHLAVHEQALLVQLAEVFPVGPLRHQVGVGQQHAGRVGVGLEHAHGLARLDEQGFVVVQVFERGEDLVKALPVARSTANAAVHHQVLGALGHLGVEVVLDHAVGRLGEPALASELAAARCADHTAGVVAGVGVGGGGNDGVVGVHGVLL
ncbi:hypothetical protein D3C71_1178640 [compost metagenome]